MQLYMVIQEREMGHSSRIPSLHFVETAASVLRKMPLVVLKEHVVGIKVAGGREDQGQIGKVLSLVPKSTEGLS